MSQSLDRALVLLDELASGPRTLDQLAARFAVHKSTVLRLLRTLESHRFVQRNGVRYYRLGTSLFELAFRALDERDVRRSVEPALRALNAETGHTVHLASYEDGEVIYIDKYESRHNVRMFSRIGRRAPLHCTAVAKVLVAALPADRRAAVAESISYERMTPNTITTPDARTWRSWRGWRRAGTPSTTRSTRSTSTASPHPSGTPAARWWRRCRCRCRRWCSTCDGLLRAGARPAGRGRRGVRRVRFPEREEQLMAKVAIHPEGTKIPTVPLTHGIRKGNILQVAGQIAVDHTTNERVGDDT